MSQALCKEPLHPKSEGKLDFVMRWEISVGLLQDGVCESAENRLAQAMIYAHQGEIRSILGPA